MWKYDKSALGYAGALGAYVQQHNETANNIRSIYEQQGPVLTFSDLSKYQYRASCNGRRRERRGIDRKQRRDRTIQSLASSRAPKASVSMHMHPRIVPAKITRTPIHKKLSIQLSHILGP
jgi:hypothetical protein